MNYQMCDCEPLDYCVHKQERDGKMAKYDHGGGCPCGLYRECECNERNQPMLVPEKTIQSEWDELHKKQTEELLKKIEEEKSEPTSMSRPWGHWYVLDKGCGFKVKKLEIYVDQSISMQYHVHRSEHWTIVQGEGKVIVDGNIFKVKKGDHFFVPRQSIHKVTNTSLKELLIAVEVQMGDICDESDIVRV